MNAELETEEKKILDRMLEESSHAGIKYECALLVPTAALFSYALWKEDVVLASVAFAAFAILRIWTCLQQDRMMKPLQSAIRKLMRSAEDLCDAGEATD